MILYRITTYHGEDWSVEWLETKAEAMTEFKKASGTRQLDKLDIPTDKECFCMALNMAHANPVNLPGERIAREEE
jgi:hypothetical protein